LPVEFSHIFSTTVWPGLPLAIPHEVTFWVSENHVSFVRFVKNGLALLGVMIVSLATALKVGGGGGL
jgi:hypothetical protein